MTRKLIVFDLDGVLFDSTAIASREQLAVYPGTDQEVFDKILEGNFHEGIKKIAHLKIKETDEEIAERWRLYAIKKLKAGMYSGAKELLEDLHGRGFLLALNTSARNRNCLPMLERTNITSLFDFLGTAEISESKADKFKILIHKYGLETKDILFVTDTLGDIREADLTDIPTVAVTWGVHKRNHFTEDAPKNLIAIVDSFDELKTLIG